VGKIKPAKFWMQNLIIRYPQIVRRPMGPFESGGMHNEPFKNRALFKGFWEGVSEVTGQSYVKVEQSLAVNRKEVDNGILKTGLDIIKKRGGIPCVNREPLQRWHPPISSQNVQHTNAIVLFGRGEGKLAKRWKDKAHFRIRVNSK